MRTVFLCKKWQTACCTGRSNKSYNLPVKVDAILHCTLPLLCKMQSIQISKSPISQRIPLPPYSKLPNRKQYTIPRTRSRRRPNNPQFRLPDWRWYSTTIVCGSWRRANNTVIAIYSILVFATLTPPRSPYTPTRQRLFRDVGSLQTYMRFSLLFSLDCKVSWRHGRIS